MEKYGKFFIDKKFNWGDRMENANVDIETKKSDKIIAIAFAVIAAAVILFWIGFMIFYIFKGSFLKCFCVFLIGVSIIYKIYEMVKDGEDLMDSHQFRQKLK